MRLSALAADLGPFAIAAAAAGLAWRRGLPDAGPPEHLGSEFLIGVLWSLMAAVWRGAWDSALLQRALPWNLAAGLALCSGTLAAGFLRDGHPRLAMAAWLSAKVFLIGCALRLAAAFCRTLRLETRESGP